MDLIPPYFLYTLVGIFGLIIGSFLDVIVMRFNTGKSLSGRSRCFSCGHTLSWYELVPLLSYFFLQGRCNHCSSAIPRHLLVTEMLTSALFVLIALVSTNILFLIPSLFLGALLLIIVLYDYRHMVIPHLFIVATLTCAFLYLGWLFYFGMTTEELFRYLLSAVGAFVFFWSLWKISQGRWIGLGDAKLAFSLSLFLTPVEAFSMIVFSFWIGALISVFLLSLQHISRSGKRYLPFGGLLLTMKSEVPFAPFMISAFVLVFFHHYSVFSLLRHLL